MRSQRRVRAPAAVVASGLQTAECVRLSLLVPALSFCAGILMPAPAHADTVEDYRLEIVVADAVSAGGTITLALVSRLAPAALLVGAATWASAAPAVHAFGHGRWGAAGASLALRALFAGASVAVTMALADRAARDPTDECGGGCGFIAGGFYTLLALPAVTAIDAGLLAAPSIWRRKPVSVAVVINSSTYGLLLGGAF